MTIVAHTTHQHLCSVTLLGNLVSTPEIRYLANPVTAVTDLMLATNHRWLDKATNTTKEWASYHQIRVVGEIVEQALLRAQKGDLLLVQGFLTNTKKTQQAIVHANFIEQFTKGFSPSINQVHCSGVIGSPIKLITTEYNKSLATFNLSMAFQTFSTLKNDFVVHNIERSVQLWGKQAKYLAENAQEGQAVIIEGRINYQASANKEQFIDAAQLHLLKKTTYPKVQNQEP